MDFVHPQNELGGSIGARHIAVRLLAKLHSIEPAWYEEHLAFLKKQYPELKDTGPK